MDPIWLTLLCPLLGAFICGTGSRALGRLGTGLTACLAMLVAALTAFHGLWTFSSAYDSTLWEWLSVQLPGGQQLSIPVACFIDPLTLTMLCVITGVGFLIHWYSVGYMSDEPDYGRYFCYLNLFVATMVCLVLANNLVMLLIGWGGVGFASFSLIGFYVSKPSAVAAARKAFLINVVGDVGLMLAIYVVALKTGSVEINTCFGPQGLTALGMAQLAVAVCMLVAAYAKSAQLPFHTWLPDAMEGPTPVSALIHAATMVTAGVYLVVRCHPLFVAADVMDVVALLGAITALTAGLAALVQHDLKRILAYSTMSQLGYMFLAAGVGAYGAAMFHLVTHAFFKALLFLTAGIIIHALHGEQDVGKMGGLKSRLSGARWAFLIGGLSLAGLPPLAGYFSKEAILDAALDSQTSDATMLMVIGVLTAGLTAYYIGRAYVLTFEGESRSPHSELHCPPFSMRLPVYTLAGLTLVAGFMHTQFFAFLTPGSGEPAGNMGVTGAAVSLGLLGVGLAFMWHRKGQELPWPSGIKTVLAGCFGFDTLIELVVVKPAYAVAGVFSSVVDGVMRDGLPGGLAAMARRAAGLLTLLQTGSLRHYTLGILSTVAVFVLLMLGVLARMGGGGQ